MDMIIALSKKGVPIHIKEAENGYQCECNCLRCGRPLNARQGDNNKWTFAHIPEKMEGVLCENANSESDIHKYAKHLFCDKGRIYLPDIHIKDGIIKKTSRIRDAQLEEVILEGADFDIQEAVVEETLYLPDGGTIRPDVLLTIKGRKLAVEIVVTHDIDSVKKAGYVSLEMSVLKIDLHGFVFKDISKEELDEMILGSSPRKTWSFNQYAFEEKRKRETQIPDANEQCPELKEIRQQIKDDSGYLQFDEFRHNPYRDWYLEWVPKCTHHVTPQRMMLCYSHRKSQFFWSCREYPECKHTEPLLKKQISCPRCHKGYIESVYIDTIRRNGFRCTNYRECTFLFIDPAQPVR